MLAFGRTLIYVVEIEIEIRAYFSCISILLYQKSQTSKCISVIFWKGTRLQVTLCAHCSANILNSAVRVIYVYRPTYRRRLHYMHVCSMFCKMPINTSLSCFVDKQTKLLVTTSYTIPSR